MVENLAFFDARHSAGSSHCHQRARTNGAGLPEARKWSKLDSDPAAIRRMSVNRNGRADFCPRVPPLS
jgi:hypothetical protein